MSERSRRPSPVRGPIPDAIRQGVPDGAGLLVAVSGGVDSTVLLHACLASGRGIRCEVAHVDHGVRAESRGDAAFVHALAQGLHLPFHLKTLTGPPPRSNMEAWGRGERYRFFESVRFAQGLSVVATGHSADDDAETLLMRLIANREPRTILAEDATRSLIRPLLSVTRAEILAYAREHQIEYLHDATNDDMARLRNAVRHRVLPLLEDISGATVRRHLAERARCLAEDIALLDDLCEEILGSGDDPASLRCLDFGSREWVAAVRKALVSTPEALRWRLLTRLFYGRLRYNLGRDHGRRVAEYLLGNGVRLELPGGVSLTRSSGRIVVVG